MDIKNIEELTYFVKKSKSLSALCVATRKDNDLFNILKERTNYLSEDVSTIERMYHIQHDIYDVCRCVICGDNLSWIKKKFTYHKLCDNAKEKGCISKNYLNIPEDVRKDIVKRRLETKSKYTDEQKKQINDKIKQTNIEKYGVDHYTKTEQWKDFCLEKFGGTSPYGMKSTQEKTKQTLMDKYGVDHNFKIPGVQEQIKNTWLEKYGVDNPLKNEEIKQKMIAHNIEKYGFACPLQNEEIYKKSKATLFKNHGVEFSYQNEEIFNKYKKTMLERYGAEFWMQNDQDHTITHISKYKEFILPNGNIAYLQGYEDYALEEVISKKYDYDDIVISNIDIFKNIPKIYYDYNGSTHRYFPDFYIKSENLIIEVKSEYTYNQYLEINNLKRQACLDNNLKFEFMIIDKNDYKEYKNNKIDE